MDDRLRESERRWRETRSAEDEARYLLERLRVGALDRDALELAAFLGRAGAVQAMGLAAHSHRRPKAWARGLHRWGTLVAGRVAVLLAEHSLAVRNRALGPDPTAEDALQRAKDWLGCPCVAHEIAAGSASAQLASRIQWTADNRFNHLNNALEAVMHAASCAWVGEGRGATDSRAGLATVKRACGHAAMAARGATVVLGTTEVWRLLAETLAPQILDFTEP